MLLPATHLRHGGPRTVRLWIAIAAVCVAVIIAGLIYVRIPHRQMVDWEVVVAGPSSDEVVISFPASARCSGRVDDEVDVIESRETVTIAVRRNTYRTLSSVVASIRGEPAVCAPVGPAEKRVTVALRQALGNRELRDPASQDAS